MVIDVDLLESTFLLNVGITVLATHHGDSIVIFHLGIVIFHISIVISHISIVIFHAVIVIFHI